MGQSLEVMTDENQVPRKITMSVIFGFAIRFR
jgi:hypothetical protein